jgi:hypothetical protein
VRLFRKSDCEEFARKKAEAKELRVRKILASEAGEVLGIAGTAKKSPKESE